MNITPIAFGLLLAITTATSLRAQVSAFTYQGRLNLNGTPATGYYDFMFRLMNDPTNGVAATLIPVNLAVPVTNGLFTTGVDFGAENFDGANRWLEISVRTNGGGPFTTLLPRQLLTSAPYAIAANTASNLLGALPASQINGTILNTSLPASPSFSGTVTANNFSGDGANMMNVNASTLGGLNSSGFWRITDNAGTTAGTHFLGTIDPQPVEIKVNGLRALRLEDNGDSVSDYGTIPDGAPNIVGGSPSNSVGPGVVGATISGGGATNYYGIVSPNTVLAEFGTVSGGLKNQILESSPAAAIAGGYWNNIGAGSSYSFIGSGYMNTVGAGSASSTISGGSLNDIGVNSDFGVVGGGYMNAISTNSYYSTIAGGFWNYVGSGSEEFPVAQCSVIGGGYRNIIETDSEFATIAGGQLNVIGTNSYASAIGGGVNNRIAPNSFGSTISGGAFNTIGENSDSVIAGGRINEIATNSSYAAIGGGYQNIITANSPYATIPGGEWNTATNWAFAAGRGAKALHTASFVWADFGWSSSPVDIASTNANSVTMRASGGYRLFSDQMPVGVFLAPGSGSWTAMSDRNVKENFRAADVNEVLEKVIALPVQTWNYKSQDASIRHVGPMAQDFKAAFQVGERDTGISTVDADGVALAAIQGLNQKLEETRAENAELKARLERLESLLNQNARSKD